MKNIFIIIITIIVAIMSSCSNKQKSDNVESIIRESPVNLVCAIDMSDRIVSAEIRQRDISTIIQVFNNFEQKVKKAHYVKSNDRFMLQLIRQTSNTPEMKEISETIHLDLSALKTSQKRKAVEQFKSELPVRLEQLYKAAGKQSTYTGCDIYDYFDQKLPAIMDMSPTEKVFLVMLTDGYIEIDPAEEKGERNGRYNTLNQEQMAALRKGDAYQQYCDVLLIPQKLAQREDLERLKVCIVGVQPKGKYIHEAELLAKIWQTWFGELHLTNQIIGYNQPSHVSAQLVNNALQDK